MIDTSRARRRGTISIMPEVHVRLRWPDGTARRYYSPSLVLTEHVEEGAAYPVTDLVSRARTALVEASERVRAKYGFPCGKAAASLAAIERDAARQPDATDVVVVEGFDR
jgi:uncharacterized repeat protein (TIGR04042 family)